MVSIRIRSTIRRIPWVLLLVLSGFTLSACSYLSPQQTTHSYSPSDGIGFDLGAVQLRNLLLIGAAHKTQAHLLAGLFNSSSQETEVTFAPSHGAPARVKVPAHGSILLAQSNSPQLSVSSSPGDREQMTISTTLGETTDQAIPLLDGTLKEYSSYTPTPEHSASANVDATPSPSPTVIPSSQHSTLKR